MRINTKKAWLLMCAFGAYGLIQPFLNAEKWGWAALCVALFIVCAFGATMEEE